MTIHCLITKICELGACLLYFSYVLAQNGGSLVTRSTPLDPPLLRDVDDASVRSKIPLK